MTTKKVKPSEAPPPEPSKPTATLADRITYALDQRQMSQKGLEDEARMSRGYVSRLLKGERLKLSPELLRRIADTLRVSYEWLATGRGDMDAASPPAARVEQLAFALEAAIAYHQGKWSAPTVAAARALAHNPEAEGLQPHEWADVLDQIEAALAKVKLRGAASRR
ncbi:MAG: helix-turn-helix transcriptional regulator [Polyangiaceae bacterium]|nr:helix-turn-helix transcriptional regulator [Polyangiaceae bacterium]